MFSFLSSLAAPLIGGLLGRSSQNDQQDFNSAEAVANRNFQERMSSTAYQRSTADLQSAGLNPMLAYTQGGASTPSGGQASVSGSWADKVQSFATATAAQAQAKLADSQADKAEAEADYIRNQQAPNTAADTELKQNQRNKLDAEVSKIGVEQINIEADTLLKGDQSRQAQAMANLYNETVEKVTAETKNLTTVTRDQIEAATKKLLAETLHVRYGFSKDLAYQAFYKSELGKAAPAIELGTGAANAINPLSKLFPGKK